MELKKKERLKSILWVWLIFLCISSTAYAQQGKDQTLKALSQRVTILEGQKQDLKEHIKDKIKVVEDDFKNKANILDTKCLKSKTEMENNYAKFKRKMEDDYNFLKILLWIFGTITVIGVITIAVTTLLSYFKLKKRILEIADEKVKKKFDSILEEKESKIIEIIDRHDKELRLKKNSNILVLTPTGSDDSSMKIFFEKMEFKKPDFQSPDDLPNLNKYHLVLFNNEDEKFKEGIIPNLVKKTIDVLFFYLGLRTKDSIDIQNEKNAAFANYGAQLYGNLINALRYQALLKNE